MGYPFLDIVQYEDGEWSIIEYQNAPVVPHLTQFKHVLQGMRNIEITRSFVEKYVKQIDPQRGEFWARERAKTAQVLAEREAADKHKLELVDKAHKTVTANTHLMDRIARNGTKEIGLKEIAKNIPTSDFKHNFG